MDYRNLMDLTGKNAVVIGGAGGIGQAIAKGLASAGAKVAIASRNENNLKKAAEEIKNEIGCDVKYYTVDVSDEQSIIELAKKSNKEMGGVCILVNSQGLNKKSPTFEMDMEVWDAMFAVNIRGMMIACREFAKYMAENKYGKIINVSSIRGIRAVKNGKGNTCYSVTKGAVDMLIKSLASEWALDGITVNGIGPIVTMTPMMVEVYKNNPDGQANAVKNVPMGRLGEPEDNIGPAIFLASAASDFVTGQIIYPDGGLASVV
ncbi:MAG: SDR family NAD(P)-dependent oxidoreductase [Lachnospiraceae bacterium]|jgi:NAD(P)-dependent dehydrogenase (short-subunit alcohol dehydrogenase family)